MLHDVALEHDLFLETFFHNSSHLTVLILSDLYLFILLPFYSVNHLTPFIMGSIEQDVIVSDTALPSRIPESNQTPANASTNKLFSLSGRTIVITGGGRGLGITLAAAAIEAGANVACLDILPEASASEWASLQKVAKSSKLTATYYRCDITDEESVSNTLDNIAEEGLKVKAPLYGTVACAGIQQKVPAVDYPLDGFRRMLDVNVIGTFLTVKHTARIFMKAKTPGSIVMIASMSGQVANRVSRDST